MTVERIPEMDQLSRINELTLQACLHENPKIAAEQRRLLDHLLAIMEHERYRTRHRGNAEYPRDYTIRWMEAIVAKAAGYSDRAQWSYIENAVRKDIGYTL